MQKILIHCAYGSFWLKDEYLEEINKLQPYTVNSDGTRSQITFKNSDDVPRDNPGLIKVFEKYGSCICMHACADDLKIVEIPDDVKWEIEDYDGDEWVSEVHRRWY